MSSRKPIHTIVLDTGPILQNNPTVSTLLSKSESLVTTSSVTSEIKDASARASFKTTLQPFLAIKTPSALSVKFVADFARRTGDLAVLSKTDIELIALAYESDCERNGGDWRLRKTPGQNGLNGSPSKCVLEAGEKSKATNVKSHSAQPEPTTAAPWVNFQATQSEADAVNPKVVEQVSQVDNGNEQVDVPEEPSLEVLGALKDLRIDDEDSVSDSVVMSSHRDPSEVTTPLHEADDSGPEDSEGWITTSNIKKVQAEEDNTSTSAMFPNTIMQVAIITTDFAMQNVVLQIGLNLLSHNLQQIRNIRTYILRCHACFQTVKDTSKQFCPRCGKPTLTRVSCSTNAKGEFKIHLKKNMQWSHRGNRYSIPRPVPGQANGKVGQGKGGGKGGWGQDLILAEDQKEYQRAMGGNRKVKGTNLMDEDYLPGLLTGDRARAGGRPKVGAGRSVNSKKRV